LRLIAKIRPRWQSLPGTNTLAYLSVTKEKSLIRLSPGWPRHDEKKFLDQRSQMAGSLRRLFPGLEMAKIKLKLSKKCKKTIKFSALTSLLSLKLCFFLKKIK
jgi:hypothetical protein